MSQGSRQQFARTFRKSSCQHGVFLTFRDFGWVVGPLLAGGIVLAYFELGAPSVAMILRLRFFDAGEKS